MKLSQKILAGTAAILLSFLAFAASGWVFGMNALWGIKSFIFSAATMYLLWAPVFVAFFFILKEKVKKGADKYFFCILAATPVIYHLVYITTWRIVVSPFVKSLFLWNLETLSLVLLYLVIHSLLFVPVFLIAQGIFLKYLFRKEPAVPTKLLLAIFVCYEIFIEFVSRSLAATDSSFFKLKKVLSDFPLTFLLLSIFPILGFYANYYFLRWLVRHFQRTD